MIAEREHNTEEMKTKVVLVVRCSSGTMGRVAGCQPCYSAKWLSLRSTSRWDDIEGGVEVRSVARAPVPGTNREAE